MPSSDLAGEAAAAVAPFAFRQLESQTVSAFTAPEDVLAAVYAEADRIRQEARELGRQEGLAEGRAEARAEINAALAAARTAAAAVRGLEQEALLSADRTVTELALRLSEQILAGTIAVEPDRVLDVVRNSLRRLSDRRRVTVLVNPEDLELLERSQTQIAAELGGVDQLDVHADRRVHRGGAIVRTQTGEIDSTIATQLARAREIAVAALSGQTDRSTGDQDGDDGLA